MIHETRIAELTEKYLNGDLSETESEMFLLLVNSNDTYKLQFEQYKTLYKTFNHISVKKQISEILFENGKSIHKKTISGKITFLSYLKYSGVAAAVSALMIIGTLAVIGFFPMKQSQNDSYTLLKNTLIDISKRQNKVNKTQTNINPVENYASGTCFPVSTNGYFITSLHLVKSSQNLILSNPSDTARYKAEVIMKDSLHDIAIIKITDTTFVSFKKLPYFINDKQYELGEYVYTLGYSKSDIVFNEGSISSVTGYLEDSTSYQLSIPANPGNSGGPIISSTGEILGILLAKNSGVDNATFAVKSFYIRNLIDSLSHHTDHKLNISGQHSAKNQNKVQFIKQLQPYIYKIEVY
jgi:S1-C subfamily serine protease